MTHAIEQKRAELGGRKWHNLTAVFLAVETLKAGMSAGCDEIRSGML